MSTLHFFSPTIPTGVTPRYESLFELDSCDENPHVCIWRETHPPTFVLNKDLASSEEVQELVFNILNVVTKNLGRVLSRPPVAKGQQLGVVSIDATHTIQATSDRMVGELVEKRLKFKKGGRIFFQKKIDLLKAGTEVLKRYFEGSIQIGADDPKTNANQWITRTIHLLFRVQMREENLKIETLSQRVEDYFKTLRPDQERLVGYNMYKERFRLVKYPDIGDTVWYCGGAKFLQGEVLEDGQIRTEVKNQERIHALFDLEEEYGREVIFLRPHVRYSIEDLPSREGDSNSSAISDFPKD